MASDVTGASSGAATSGYRTLAARCEASVTIDRSEFIAAAFPTPDEAGAFAVLEEIRKANPKARHNVWAYVLRDGRERYSDDGEPQKTAGVPTLEVLRHSGLVDACIVTTRYFGGVLLGAGGLVRAYTQAAQKALAAAEVLEYTSCVTVRVGLDYGAYAKVAHMAGAAGGRVGEAVFATDVMLPVTFRFGEEQAFLADVRELTGGRAHIEVDDPRFERF